MGPRNGRKLVEKVIGGRKFRIRQLGADTQDALLACMLLGASTGKLTVADVLGAKDALRAETKVEIVDEQSPEETKPRTWVPLDSVYDELLADDPKTRAAWLAAAVEVSFGNFSDALDELVALQRGLSSSTSPKTRAGS